MTVTLAGLGCGTPATITAECREALEAADLISGAARLLDSLPEVPGQRRFPAVRVEDLLELFRRETPENPCVVYSGDTGFYSGARQLIPKLRETGTAFRVLPGISSVQLLSARLCRPWQGWNLVSAHGAECDPVSAVMSGKPTFFLTGGTQGPAALCRDLTAAGLGELPVTVGENLSGPAERIVSGTAAAFAEMAFASLSVLLADPAPVPFPRRSAGIPDEAFAREKVPMTKQEVRAAVLAKLAVRPDDTAWDVGAGTGSVSVELALAAPNGRTYAVECREAACELTERNRARFGAWNLTLIRGTAPEALAELPPPNAVFVGGSGGRLAEIVDAALSKNPSARLCFSAIALETLSAAVAALTAHGLTAEVVQIAVSRTKAAGSLHLLTANNPVFLITAKRGDP